MAKSPEITQYDELFDLMFKGESVKKVPLHLRNLDPTIGGTYHPWSAEGNPFKAFARALGFVSPSNAPLDPWININKNYMGGMTDIPGLNKSKELRYVMAHELGHAKDFNQHAKGKTPAEFRKLVLQGRLGGLFGKLNTETRGAQIHLPFLKKYFGKNALSDYRKKDFLIKERLGDYPEIIKKEHMLKEIRKVHGNKYISPFVEQILNTKDKMVLNTGFKYQNFARIARSAGLMGLLLAIGLPMFMSKKKGD